MKILFFTSGNVKSNFTYRIVQLASSMKKNGNLVSIIAPSADKYNDFRYEKITEIDGVRVIQPFQFKTKNIVFNLFPYILHTLFILIKEKPEIVYIYKPTPISVVGLMAKWFFKSKVILDMDDVGSEVMKIEGHPYYQVKLVEWCEELSIKFADGIITASSFLNNRYKNEYNKENIITISNGVDESWFNTIVNTPEKNRMIFMGSINRINILEPLFNVVPNIIKKVPDFKLLIIGDGKFLDYFKNKAEKLNIINNVEFTGWLPIDKARELLYAGDIGYCYMPNELTTKSASNMKVMQYMARGVLPLVSDIGDLPSYVDHGEVGYIAKPNNEVDLENVILASLNDTIRLDKSKNVQDFSVKNFDWDKLSENIEVWISDTILNKNKKVFYISTCLPGDFGGAEIRNFHLLKFWLKENYYQVKLFCISNRDIDFSKKYIKKELNTESHVFSEKKNTIFNIFKSLFIYCVPPSMNNFKDNDLKKSVFNFSKNEIPGILHISQVHAYYAIRKYIPWFKKNGVKIVLDCHNIEFKLLKDSSKMFSFFKKIVAIILSIRLKYLEIEAAKNADLILVCSELDKEFFVKYNKNTIVVPNGVDVDKYINIKPSLENSLIFIGGTGYPPNADSIKYYVKNIHDLVKKEIKDIKVYLVGADKEWLKNNNITDDSIVPLGFVDDINIYLEKAGVGISPIRYGSGTRLKIMTYMAAGLPVVSTTKGAEGVSYENGKDIIITDNPIDFASSIIKLLKDREFSKNIASNGKTFVSSNYSWGIIGDKLINILKNV